MARRSFKEAVQATPDIADAYKSGISALGSYSKKVVVPNKRLFGGSVDIDVATKTYIPMIADGIMLLIIQERRFL